MTDPLLTSAGYLLLKAGTHFHAVIDAILATPFSRVPLWENEPENIIGIVHAKDLLKQLRRVNGDRGAACWGIVPPLGRPDPRLASAQEVNLSSLDDGGDDNRVYLRTGAEYGFVAGVGYARTVRPFGHGLLVNGEVTIGIGSQP